jgi:hypothetical protein
LYEPPNRGPADVQTLGGLSLAQGVDPYTYLVGILWRVGTHPAADVHFLTLRLWKASFAANPLRSDVDS